MKDFLHGVGHNPGKKDNNLMNIQSMNMNINRPSLNQSNKQPRAKTGQYRQRRN